MTDITMAKGKGTKTQTNKDSQNIAQKSLKIPKG
jgi:hypothetical protein